jgi:hypothetical protein
MVPGVGADAEADRVVCTSARHASERRGALKHRGREESDAFRRLSLTGPQFAAAPTRSFKISVAKVNFWGAARAEGGPDFIGDESRRLARSFLCRSTLRD